MSRKSIPIEQSKAKAIIDEIEKDGPLSNRSLLCKKVAELYSSRHGLSFSFSFLNNKINEWNLEIKTPKGERGAHLKGGNTEALNNFRTGGEPLAKRPKGNAAAVIARFAQEEGGKYLKTAKSIGRGSLKAGVKAMCLDHSAFDKTEIKYCQVIDCPLWPLRPYQSDMSDFIQNSSKEVVDRMKSLKMVK